MKQNIVGFVVKQIGIGVLFLILIAINLGCGFLYMVFDAMTDPRGTMAAREEKIRENVIPALLERNGLDACPVKCLPKDDSARFRIEVADPSRYEAIAEDVFRLERTIHSVRMNQVYILEFDQPFGDLKTAEDWRTAYDFYNESGFVIIVIPDAVRGYDGRIEWHTDDFTPTVDPDAKEEAQE